jgi:hypothetical protein
VWNTAQADDETPWPRVMQALSHFSYHQSGGQHVLCDLQGGVYRDGIVLTDPAVLSRTKEYAIFLILILILILKCGYVYG